MFSIKEMYDDIVLIAEMLEDNYIDNFKFPKGTNEEAINNWEKKNNVLLPDGYKNFILLSNGFVNHGAEIYSLDQITQLDFPDDFKGYYEIGSYIGDGSLILIDKTGNFYYGDHVYGIYKSTFEEFVKKWILEDMKESLEDNNIPLPKNLKTNN